MELFDPAQCRSVFPVQYSDPIAVGYIHNLLIYAALSWFAFGYDVGDLMVDGPCPKAKVTRRSRSSLS